MLRVLEVAGVANVGDPSDSATNRPWTRCDLTAIPREAWRELTPGAFARSHGQRGQALLLRSALPFEGESDPGVRQAKRWSPEFILERSSFQSFAELGAASLPEVGVAFGESVALEDATHSSVFVGLRPLTPVFAKDGPLAALRSTQLLFIVPPGAGFGIHLHRKEDGYNLLLQGGPQLWWFPSGAHSDLQTFSDSCRAWWSGASLANLSRIEGTQFCVQSPGDAMWLPAGVPHAMCSDSSGDLASVSTGGRGDFVGWTRAMLAARDGSIPLLQRALNVAAMSNNVARDINKARRSGPDENLVTAVHLAASRGHAAALEWLLKRGGSLGPGEELSHGAGKRGASIEEPHPHHFAAMHGHFRGLEMLASYGANLTAIAGPHGQTAAEWAARSGHAAVVQWFAERTTTTIRGQHEL